jgi:hypothetical protein
MFFEGEAVLLESMSKLRLQIEIPASALSRSTGAYENLSRSAYNGAMS